MEKPSPEIEKLGHRIEELNNKCTQVLTFLSFAIAAGALFWSAGQKHLVHWPLRFWALAMVPTLLGILPLKEICEDNARWYGFIRRFKVAILVLAIVSILFGAFDFACNLVHV
jgi:hypothetical protein